jgi:hypothetical protein
VPNHETTRGMIQLVSKLKMIQEGYSPSSSDNNITCLLPIELRVSTGLSGSLSTRFPLHKEVPSLLNSPSTTSPYQCRFLSGKYQVVALYCSSLDLGLLSFRVIINKLDELPIFFKESSLFSSTPAHEPLCLLHRYFVSLLLTRSFSGSCSSRALHALFFFVPHECLLSFSAVSLVALLLMSLFCIIMLVVRWCFPPLVSSSANPWDSHGFCQKRSPVKDLNYEGAIQWVYFCQVFQLTLASSRNQIYPQY